MFRKFWVCLLSRPSAFDGAVKEAEYVGKAEKEDAAFPATKP